MCCTVTSCAVEFTRAPLCLETRARVGRKREVKTDGPAVLISPCPLGPSIEGSERPGCSRQPPAQFPPSAKPLPRRAGEVGVGQRGLWKMSLCGSIVFPWPFRRLPWSLVNARGLALASLLLSRGQGCRVAQSGGNSALCVYQPLLASRPSEQHRVLYHRAGGCAARRGGPGALGWGLAGLPSASLGHGEAGCRQTPASDLSPRKVGPAVV